MSEKPQDVLKAQGWLEEHEQQLIEDTRAMLRIPSIEGAAEPGAPFGKDVRQALHFALSLGEKWGMRTRDVDGYAGHCEFGDAKPMVMALGHLDVVPVGDGWKHDPFGAEIDGEYIYARGAEDDKGPTMAAFYAARALKEINANLPARIRVVFGCDEESGFECVKHYFQFEEAPTYGIAPDSGWPLYHAEKGIANVRVSVPKPSGPLSILSLEAGSRPNIVPDKCTLVLSVSDGLLDEVKEKVASYWDRNAEFEVANGTVIVRARGKASHGAYPFGGDNAVVRALRAAVEFAPPEQQKVFTKLVEIGHPSGVGLGIHGRDDVSEDLTSNLGIVETNGDNVIFTVNVRYPVTWTGADLMGRISKYLSKELNEASILDFNDSPSLYFPLDQEPVVSIMEVYKVEVGDGKEPGVMGGGTYARAVPNTVSVGTGWEGDGPAHEHDERIKVGHLLKMAKIYVHILYRLAHAAAK